MRRQQILAHTCRVLGSPHFNNVVNDALRELEKGHSVTVFFMDQVEEIKRIFPRTLEIRQTKDGFYNLSIKK